METKNNTKELATTTDTVLDFKSIEEIQAWGDKIAKSQLTPLKEGKDVVVAVLFGRELGMPPMVSVNNIYPINGKGTLSVHMINALLQKHGVVIENIRQYEPCIMFALKGEDGKAAIFDAKGNVAKRDDKGNIPEGCSPMILREGFADETPKEHEVRGTKIVNYKTIIRLTRKLKQPDGTFKEMSVDSSYSLAEATSADFYPKKDNWKNFPKQMCHARALAFGGRMIAADLTLGMYETSEIADTVKGMQYDMKEDGHIEILNNDVKEPINTSSIQTVEEVKEESLATVIEIKNPSKK